MSDKKTNSQPKQSERVEKGIDYNKYREINQRNYSDSGPKGSGSKKETSGTGPRDKKG